jgi:hypothetical protein
MGRCGEQANIPSNIVHTVLTPTTHWCSVHDDFSQEMQASSRWSGRWGFWHRSDLLFYFESRSRNSTCQLTMQVKRSLSTAAARTVILELPSTAPLVAI